MLRRLFSFILLTLLATGVVLNERVNPVKASPQTVDSGYAVEVFATGLDGPFGMAFDGEGNLYVANEGPGGGGTIVSKITPDGAISTFASGFFGPSGLAFDTEGNLFVSDDQCRIWKVYPNGTTTVFLDYDYGNPNALAFDADGNLIVPAHGGNMYRITPDANLSVIASGLNGPQSVALDDEGNIYTSEADGTILRIDPFGSVGVFSIGVFHSTNGGLARDAGGNLYASDSGQPDPRIYVFAPDGEGRPYVTGFDSYPRGLAFDSQGRLYISECDAGIIWRVDVALNKVTYDVEHGFWFDTENDSISNTLMPCWHEWIFQMGNEPDESREAILNPGISVLTEHEFVSYYPPDPDVSNGTYSWSFSLEVPEGAWLPVFAREANFIEYRRPGIVAERHVTPETLSGPVTIQNITLDLVFEDPLPDNLTSVNVGIQMPSRNLFEDKRLVNYSVVSLSQVDDWQTGTTSWSADPRIIRLGNSYRFSAVLEAVKSPDLLGSPTSKPGISVSYATAVRYEDPIVGSSVTVSHPDGPVVTFSSEGDCEWLGSAVYNRIGIAFNQVVSEIVQNPDPPPLYLTKIPATVDVGPERINLRSRGKWTPCHIELPEGYDLNDVNVSSIRLDDAVPAQASPTTIGDYDNDGVPDLTFRFNRTEIQKHMLSQGFEFGDIVLKVSGGLLDGTLFEGTDIVRVSRLVGDVNCDGEVNIFDLVQSAIIYGSKEENADWDANANFADPWDTINIFDLVTTAKHYNEKYT